jgi:hypothetical protein
MICKLLILSVLLALSASAQTCDRTCLEGFVDKYMEALIAHQPSVLPTAQRVKNTEDGVLLELGDGFWRTALAKGSYRLIVPDAETGQVAFMGTMREVPSNPVIVTVRLRIQNQRISEIENMVIRDANAAMHLENRGRPAPVFFDNVAQRASRSDLIRTTNQYFDGLQKNDGKGNYPFTDDCQRIQNGVQTTHNPNALAEMQPPAPPGRGAKGAAKQAPAPPKPILNITELGCLEQFKSGYYNFVTRVRDRRFVAVDGDRGVVAALVSMDMPTGKYNSFKLADGRPITAGPARPTTLSLMEVFKIDSGKIRRIEAAQLTVPYGMLSGWSTWEEGMSSRPRDLK